MNFFVKGTEGVEAFAQRWTDGMWMCPPVSLLPAVAREIRRRRGCSGIVLVPRWPTASFYTLFFDKNSNALPPFVEKESIRPYIYQNQGAEGPLNGKIKFDLVVLYFKKN